MKQKYTKITFLIILLSLVFLASPVFVFAEENCVGNVCVSTNSIPSGAPLESKEVNLTFKLTKKTTGSICSSGNNLYSFINYYERPRDQSPTYVYIRPGTGDTATYTFSSLTKNTPHMYGAVFYCNRAPYNPNINPTDLARGAENLWQSPLYSQTTTSATGKKYACKDGRGVYVCGNKPDLSDLLPEDYVEGGECDEYKSSFPQIDASLCGKKAGTGPATINAVPLNTIDCTKVKDSDDCIYNPLPTEDLGSTFLLIVKGLLGIVGIWAVMFIIVGGFRMVTSAGNEEAVTQAKKTITWAVLGAAAALLSFSIINIVQNLLHNAVR